jgi:uncharacterized FlaG/YvyC family protein
MKIDNAQALTAQSSPFVGKDALSKVVTTVALDTSNAKKANEQASQSVSQPQSLSLQTVTQANKMLKTSNSELQFQLDQDAGKMVLYLKDSKTGETLHQFPDKEALRISKQINDYLEGLKSHQHSNGAVGQLSGLITDTKA